MKPEAADYLEKARSCLQKAKTIAAAEVYDVAAREAYLALFHAAEAYIFEQTGRAAKTHRGVRNLLGRLAIAEPRIPRTFVTFLREGYELKTTADYGIGYADQTISAGDANLAIETATLCVECIAGVMT
jgi:uncharacterized protein (UPF0332 family)